MSYTRDEVAELMRFMTRAERDEFAKLYGADARATMWRPLPGPQTMAYLCEADILGFGGAAGGGKTDLAVGKALTQHRVVQWFRKHGTELTPVYDRLAEILGRRDFADKYGTWRVPRKPPLQIEFGSLANPGDETKHQGHPKDLLILEEVANMLEAPVRFLMGWVRSTIKGQRKQVLMTFNPPTTSEGRWVVEYYAPWLDPRYPAPALPGELRWYITVAGKDHEVLDDRARVLVGGRLQTNFDAKQHRLEDVLLPQSRTFIPSRISDNPYLVGTQYMATLQALPEPLRSQMLYGDFTAGMKDSEWQVIPTAWVEAAMNRWKAREVKNRMSSVGADIARGGEDNTVVSRLHEDNWFDELLAYPGLQTPDGYKSAGLIIVAVRDRAPIHVDVIGVGAATYDVLKLSQQTIGVNVATASTAKDKTGMLDFMNLRSQLWWQMREALDPNSNLGLALPPDRRVLADLTAPMWELRGKTICVESREAIIKRIGRSPDYGSAIILAWVRTPRMQDIEMRPSIGAGHAHDPYAALDYVGAARQPYDPYRTL